MADGLDKILKILVVIIFIVGVFIPLLSSISNTLNEQQAQPYIQTIQQKEAEISSLKNQLAQTNTSLGQLNNTYEKLIRENITKNDFQEMKYSLNNTQAQINLLNQKFEIVNSNFVSVYNQTFLYFSLSIVINIFFVLFILGDIISVSVFEIDIKKKVIEWIIKKIKKNNKKVKK